MKLLKISHTLQGPEDLFFAMPQLEFLTLDGGILRDGFLQGNPNGQRDSQKLFPSLKSLRLEWIGIGGNGWKPLITYLKRQSSDGELISLVITSEWSISSKDKEQIKALVGDFEYIEEFYTDSD